jgi:arsenate reductase
MAVKIYHNPRCTKSREMLELIRENGVQPEIVEYLKTPLSSAELASVIKLLGILARDLLRKNEDAYKENNLANVNLSDADIIKIMIKNPVLIERPIVVVDNKKAAIGRPPENVLGIL